MSKKTFFITLAALLVLLAVGTGVYIMRGTDTFMSQSDSDQPQLSEKEIESVIAGVASHIRLPEGEDPVIASIVDIDQLVESQPFYQGAENGDFLLIYPEAAKAIIYSQKRDIIVNVGPIIIDEAAPSVSPTVSDELGEVEE